MIIKCGLDAPYCWALQNYGRTFLTFLPVHWSGCFPISSHFSHVLSGWSARRGTFFLIFLPGGRSGFYVFHLFLTFIILSVADRQELFLLFIPAACGRIIVTGQRKTVRIFLYFSFLSLFLRFYFHLIKCLAYKTIRFHRIDRNWPYNESFKTKFVKSNV